MMKAEVKALLERAAKYIAKGLEMGAYTETVGGNLFAERFLKAIRKHLTAARPLRTNTKVLLGQAAAYVAKGLEMGAYTETAGGNLFAERLLGQLSDYIHESDEKFASSKYNATRRVKKSPAQLQNEIDTVLARMR